MTEWLRAHTHKWVTWLNERMTVVYETVNQNLRPQKECIISGISFFGWGLRLFSNDSLWHEIEMMRAYLSDMFSFLWLYPGSEARTNPGDCTEVSKAKATGDYKKKIRKENKIQSLSHPNMHAGSIIFFLHNEMLSPYILTQLMFMISLHYFYKFTRSLQILPES